MAPQTPAAFSSLRPCGRGRIHQHNRGLAIKGSPLGFPASKKRRRVAAQGYPLQCAEGITGRECARPWVISESIGIPSHL